MLWRFALLTGIVAATTLAALGTAFAQDQTMADADPRFRHIIDHEHV